MSYSTLMVLLDWWASNETQLKAAGDLAERFHSTVIGLVPADESTRIGVNAIYAQEPTARERIDFQKSVAACEAEFLQLIKGRAEKFELRTASIRDYGGIARLARIADLVVAMGANAGENKTFRHSLLNNIVLQSGRPFVLVPSLPIQAEKRKNTLIAWKDTIEARRAASFALPLLRTSENVIIASIPESKFDRGTTATSVIDIQQWLNRHGISASTIVPEKIGNVSAQLEAIAQQTSTDIIVAGAYGRSPARERILGGITRSLLSPVSRYSFLAH